MQFRQETCENDVVWNCCAWLNANGWYAWRNQSQATFDKASGTYRRPAPFQISGVSDIIAIKDGQTTYIEAKFDKGKLDKDQLLFEKQCHKHGVRFICVWGLGDLQRVL